jgi:hypothetical protein
MWLKYPPHLLAIFLAHFNKFSDFTSPTGELYKFQVSLREIHIEYVDNNVVFLYKYLDYPLQVVIPVMLLIYH